MDEAYVAGRFEPLWNIAKDRNLHFDHVQDLVGHVADVLGLDVVVDSRDGVTLGVEIHDQDEGCYRFKR
eukprot:1278794-Pyramimonas_sp.AAC.1